MITITNSHKRGFWRGGHHHPRGDKEWSADTFSEEQLDLIVADERLFLRKITVTDRRGMIFAAIQALDPENKEQWTGKGAPQIAALEAASVLSDISAKERDELWAEYQEIQEGEA